MTSVWISAAALSGATGVALGAFGAHALKARLSADLLTIFEVGVRYQMYHALALFAVAWVSTRFPGTWTNVAGGSMLAGILLFSGSLYLMAFSGARWLGAITPLGGVCFILGWLALLVAVLRAP